MMTTATIVLKNGFGSKRAPRGCRSVRVSDAAIAPIRPFGAVATAWVIRRRGPTSERAE